MKRKIFSDLLRKKGDPIQIEQPRRESTPKREIEKSPVPTTQRAEPFIIPPINHPWRPLIERLFPLIILGIGVIVVVNIIMIAQRGAEVKDTVASATATGYKKLLSGGDKLTQKDFEGALADFTKAQEQFETARKEIWFLTNNANRTPASKILETADAVVAMGLHLSKSFFSIMVFLENTAVLPTLFLQANDETTTFTLTSTTAPRPSLTDALKKELPLLQTALTEIQESTKQMNRISETLVPSDLRDEFRFARGVLTEIAKKVAYFQSDIPAIIKLLGDPLPHRYMVILQNNNELRPTGGFIGSYLLIDVNEGYISKSAIHDVYQTDYQLKEVIKPPDEIALLTDRWFLRDANYSADFPTSAKKIAWFLEKEGGPSVDTVIAIDESVIEDLLEITGPIHLPGFSQDITKDNFNTLFSYVIESKLSGADDPKRILKKFAPLLQKTLLEKSDPQKLAAVFGKNMRERHLMMYSKEENIQQFFERMGLSGAMTPLSEQEDYLSIIHSNIGGNKSDLYVNEAIQHDSFIDYDGGIINELTITRKHTWNLAAEQKWFETIRAFGFEDIAESVKEVLGRGKNVVFTKIYVPNNSQLLSINDTDILDYVDPPAKIKTDPDTKRLYFFTRLEVEHGKTIQLKIRYRLPFTLDLSPADTYFLTVQKQMGGEQSHLTKRIFPDYRLRNIKYAPKKSFVDNDGVLTYQAPLSTDTVIASLWAKD